MPASCARIARTLVPARESSIRFSLALDVQVFMPISVAFRSGRVAESDGPEFVEPRECCGAMPYDINSDAYKTCTYLNNSLSLGVVI